MLMKLYAGILAVFGFAGEPAVQPAPPHPATYAVAASMITDEKSVFATIESGYVVPARVRTGGTILELRVRQGDHVDQGQVIATIGDQKLALEATSYAAQIQAAQAQVNQSQTEFERAKRLLESGSVSQNAYDRARTAYEVAVSGLNTVKAQRAVVQQREKEGQVLAPTAGRVIAVPLIAGSVAMAGDIVATVAAQNFVLRLQVPERHAHHLKAGDPVRLDGGDLGLTGPQAGTITLVYPQVENGHVIADASVGGLPDYFVGQRVRVWVPAGERSAIVVPEDLVTTRFGLDYVRLWANGAASDAPVQRGQSTAKGLEILSGLKPGDELLRP